MQLTELHRHIDCSIRPSTMVELAKRFGARDFKDEEDVRQNFWLTEQVDSLEECLEHFILFQQVLVSLEARERIAYEAIEDAYREGITKLELRYSPRFASSISKLPWEDVLQSFQRGIAKAKQKYKIEVGLICIVSRGDDKDVGYEAVEFAITHKKDFIGVDLAGVEAGYPCRQYKEIFQRARNAGLPITIHAGEALGPENVWEAIDLLGATRIGHGIQAIKDRELMKRMARDQILIETCPTSNFITKGIQKWADHPLPKFLEAGIPCSISTDDPGIFGTTMQEEFDRCKKHLGMSEADISKANEFAKQFTFLS